MKTRSTIIIYVFLALIVVNVILYFALRGYVSNLMLVLEKEQATMSIQRLLNAIERETATLDQTNHDWAAWDDTYQFMVDRNDHYLTSNMVYSTHIDYRLDLIVLVDSNGKAIYEQAYDRKEKQPLPVPDAFFSILKEQPDIWKFSEPDQFKRGFLKLPEGVLQLSARPIITSNENGPVRGTMFMGRFFSEQEQKRIAALTEQPFSLQANTSLKNTGLEPEDPTPRVVLIDDNQLLATGKIKDLRNQPLWQIDINFPRSFYQHGRQSLIIFMRWNFLYTGILALILVIIGYKLSQTRRRLEKSKQSYRTLSLELQTILDGITSPILLISKDMMVIWTNKSGANLYNISVEEIAGKLEVNLPFQSFSDNRLCPVAQSLKSGQPEKGMATLPDGKVLTMSAFPLSNTAETSGVICLMTDLTDQIRLCEEAEQRNRLTTLGEMAAGLAHDINNPISMLMVNLPMIRDVCHDMKIALEEQSSGEISATFGGLSFSFLKEKMPYLLKEMINNTNKIQKLSEEMKDYSQFKDIGSAETFNLNEVVKSSVRLANHRLRKVTRKLHIQLDDNLPDLQGRPHQIEQVIINLLLNAGQALTSTDQAIRLKTGFDPQTTLITLEVIDEGVGIAEEDLPEITKPFFTTKKSSGGIGLGLSLSTRIIKEHGGILKFSSTPGAGTIASVILPSNGERL